MLDFVLNNFITLLVVVDPVGLAPIFMGLAHGGSAQYRRKMAIKGTLTAAGILIGFMVLGDFVLRALGIGLPAFRVAGGALLFLLAVEMVFARQSGMRSTTPRERQEAEHKEDISVFPLAIPLIAGPGAMTTVLLMVTSGTGQPILLASVLGVVVAVLLITLAALLAASRIMHLMGQTGANVVTRVLGVVLAALAVQFVFDGLTAGFPALSRA